MARNTTKADDGYAKALQRIQDCSKNRGRTHLDLRGLFLTTLPPEVGQLTDLTWLTLSDNWLTTLPPEIGQLTALAMLYLDNNKFATLPPEIGQLTALTSLVLNSNQLTTLPPEIGGLTALTSLGLNSNQLTMLPPEIGRLTALTSLVLNSNQLTTLPPDIGRLTALEGLHLRKNQLTTLPPEIGRLTALTSLFISWNLLTTLPPEIGQLTALKNLELAHNHLATVPPEIGELTQLEGLNLVDNALTALPESLKSLRRLKALELHRNDALGIPTELLGKYAPGFPTEPLENDLPIGLPTWGWPSWFDSVGPANPQDILDYYFAQQAGSRRPLNEVKVLVVGESAVGKTSLIRHLRGETYNLNEDKTHGIERHRLLMMCGRLGEVRLNVWDFGGQDIMHATHQFFLTHRSVYLLVLDSRQNERQSRIDYWLRLIASYGGDSPVIVVSNKADQQVMQLNWTGLQREYPQIKAFAREVSCYHVEGDDRRKGLDELKQHIAVAVATHVAEVDKPILTSWLNLKYELEKDGRDYLTLDEYHALAAQRGIKDQRDREVLLTLMHRLGSVLHFSEHAIFDRDRQNNAAPPHVEELNVLHPGWVTGAIYKLLNDAELIRAGGIMDRGSMRRSLAALPGGRYPANKEEFIIAMMRRFEICFAFDGEQDRWFLPDLLHKEEVDTGDWTDALWFRYQYRVLPNSVIGRLMVRLHAHIARHCLWRTGAKFNRDTCEALVRSEPEATVPRIDIFIRGGKLRARQELLALIRGTLEDIHLSFSDNLAVEKLVAAAGQPDVFLDYERLLLLEGKGTTTDEIKVVGKLVELEVADALNNVTERKSRDKERISLAQKAQRKRHEKKADTIINVQTLQIGDTTVKDDHSTHIGRDNYGQVGQTLTNCTNMVQRQAPGERKNLLEALSRDVQKLIANLPEEKKDEAPQIAKELELLVETTTGEKPNRRWYSVSAEGLLEASKWAKDFTGNIAGTILSLGKAIWPDFKLPG